MDSNVVESFLELIIDTFYSIFILSIFAVPLVLGYVFWKNWLKYVRTEFVMNQKNILLELRLPAEILKSPVAMEIFITALYQTGGEGTWIDKYWKGSMRPWFSLEMVSLGGEVKFYIWTRERLRKVLESTLYSQYPDIEIFEAVDYTKDISYDPEKNELWGCMFTKSKDSHYPIKTYVDYGLNKDPKEEVKIDPITPVIEFLGSLGQYEMAWIQIMVRAHKAEIKDPVTGKMVDWKEAAKADVKKKKGDGADKLTGGERGAIEAIEKSISKFAFDCGIRALYIAQKGYYNAANIPGLSGTFKQYNSSDLNGFKPAETTSFDYPWQDPFGGKLYKKKVKIINAYKERAFFPPAYSVKLKPFVLNSEELATIYHFPGSVARTPSFSRISAKKSEAPANLPI